MAAASPFHRLYSTLSNHDAGSGFNSPSVTVELSLSRCRDKTRILSRTDHRPWRLQVSNYTADCDPILGLAPLAFWGWFCDLRNQLLLVFLMDRGACWT